MTYEIDFILEKIKSRVQGKMVRINDQSIRISSTLLVIAKKGSVCVECGAKGTHFEALAIPDKESRVSHSLIMIMDNDCIMTRDHIVPAGSGGSNQMSNLQPMCETCNHTKADIMPKNTIKVLDVVQTKNTLLSRLSQVSLKHKQSYHEFHRGFMAHRHLNNIGRSLLTADEEKLYFRNMEIATGYTVGKRDKKYNRVAV